MLPGIFHNVAVTPPEDVQYHFNICHGQFPFRYTFVYGLFRAFQFMIMD